MIEIGEKLSGRYQINDVIGQGGMANVFLAHDLILNRDVAVKVLRFDFQDNQDAIRRFQREAMSASQLLHHNIVEVYDVDETDQQQYIVMEYVKGTDLKSFIQKHAPLSLELTVSIMSQILSAIEVAHKNRIIHRDIKPQNILITEQNEVKITDFGIAIALSDTSITQTNTLLGSVHYLSPEQARGSNATTKSDIYALGVVLYELITGSVPFNGESAVSIALKHFQETFPRVKDSMDYVPQSLENVVLRATAKSPADRYDSVEAMHQDLITSLSANRMNEKVFVPSNLSDTVVLKPIQPITSAKVALDEQMEAPDPLDETYYQHFDEVSSVEPVRKNYRFIRWLVGILMLILLGLGAYYVYAQTTRYVVVPDVYNKTQAEAEAILKKHHLTVEKVVHQWDNTIAQGTAIETKPEANTRVSKNSKVQLVVSNGKEQVEIGDYVGQRYEPIRQQLTDANFIVDRRGMATTDPSKVGVILSQSVKPGSKVVPSDTTITFTVGQMSDSVTMQNFENLPLSMVEKFAEEYGLNVETTYEYDNYIPEGQVISQSPASGTTLVAGDTISVVVSKGVEEEIIVPVRKNLTLEYVPRYAEDDEKMEKPLPNIIKIYIGDARNNINTVNRTFEITEDTPIQLLLYIANNGVGQYRIVRDGEVYLESNEVYPE
ncbi:Stk1 family PASTA domain-containing Ser/Thr kinase [Tuanshanicoccus lijuaniae]|uniref:Stk1 family PASTA domain-containing Ser/Thr kinase n=1 Tax=Aerococcaceae bacterium zg-1292 TaxID=2774330 RepID=UPI001BD85255|nr:Stk1 family PASTA domain-containing Ser/Thr kinase [Aerococcaceae bacterium zg-A91]MBS4458639.1 Stk1 family PASTA domain-containing Ser/Thr kinase [Aerococcaceae bacterium zg-BR33]